MKQVDVYFLLLATVLLLIGAGLGIMMGSSGDFQLSPVHAHINLAGWASLALFGLTYRCYPQLARRRLAMFHFILSGTSAILLPVGIGLAVLRDSSTLAIIASNLFLAGVLVFLIQLASVAREKESSLSSDS